MEPRYISYASDPVHTNILFIKSLVGFYIDRTLPIAYSSNGDYILETILFFLCILVFAASP